MKPARLLLYSDIYTDNKTVDDLLKGIPSKLILQFLSRIQFLNKKLHDLKFELEFVKSLIEAPNYISIEPALSKLYNQFSISIFDTFTTLTFIEYVLENYNDEDYNQFENENLSFFKAYLLVNQELDNSGTTNEILNDELSKVVKSQFGKYSFRYFDLSKHFVSQCIKLSLLDRYIDASTSLKSLKILFLAQYNFTEWKEYLFHIFMLLKTLFENFKLSIPKEDRQLYSSLLAEITNYNPNGQFIELRKRPLIPFDETTFLVPFQPFVVNKINDTIYFNLKELINKNQTLFPDISSNDFKSKFDYEFSEQFVFYSAINRVFGSKYIQKTGEDLSFDGSIDYYIRNGNKIFLFEHKSSLISDKAKTENSFYEIENELHKKLVKKGIAQLLNNIEKLKNGDYSQYDSLVNYRKSTIYPILVITDDSLTDPGVNSLFRKWWSQELSGRNQISGNKKIQDVILFHVNDLLYYQNYLNNLDVIIKKYFKYIKYAKGINKYISFSEFIEMYLDRNKPQYMTDSSWTNFVLKYLDD